jgi:hypothetical protein
VYDNTIRGLKPEPQSALKRAEYGPLLADTPGWKPEARGEPAESGLKRAIPFPETLYHLEEIFFIPKGLYP